MDTRGNIVYASAPYPGHISDQQITELCKPIFEKYLWPGAAIMCDKGFTQLALMSQELGFTVVMPPRLNIKRGYSMGEASECLEIAEARIHVERAIRRAKAFRFLTREVTVAELANFTMPSRVCFYLSNLISPLVVEENDMTDDVLVVDYL